MNILNTIKNMNFGLKVTILAAVMSLAGIVAMPAAASARSNSTFPTSRSECRDWRDYELLDFDNRADCNQWVRENASGYGGNGNGNGGNPNLGQFINKLFSFLNEFFDGLFHLFGKIFG